MPQQRTQHSGMASGLSYGLRLVIVAILAALVTQPAMVSETHAQASVPAAPTGLTAASVSHDSVTLSWDDPDDDSITGYQVLRRDVVNQAPGTFSTVEPNTGSAATSYTDSTVDAETRYAYRVKAINGAGTSEQSSYVNVETLVAPAEPPSTPVPTATPTPTPNAPSSPTGLAATLVSHDRVTLGWNDPGDSSITGYQVLRRSRDGDAYGDGQGTAQFVAIVDDTGSAVTTYTDTSVTARTRYVYRAKAINSEGMSEQSNYVNVETLVAPAEPPSTPVPTATPTPKPAAPSRPTGLTTTFISHNSVTLSWDDPGDSSITGYQVLRRFRDGVEYGDGEGATAFVAIVDDTGSSVTTYTDTSVRARARYVYRVKAINAGGTSEQSTFLNVTTLETPAPQSGSDRDSAQPCEDGYVPPTPTEVAITAVPIVVESTAEDYFVLYVSHDVDGKALEYPVLVKRGEADTTTLEENVAALPIDRYRVEKYSIANPADVDVDCIDDVTELNRPGAMNPANRASNVSIQKGAVVIPDRETFETLAYSAPSGTSYIKFSIIDLHTESPSIYFQNVNNFPHHRDFLYAIGRYRQDAIPGTLMHNPELIAPDGSHGLYWVALPLDSLEHFESAYTMLAASMPALDDNLALWIRNHILSSIQAELPLYRASRMNLVFDEDVYGDPTFQALNPGEGYGLLRSLEPDERPHSRDVVIYETLPNELPRVAGIITTVAQTPLSHVNLRALQDNIPNAFIADALEDEDVSNLMDGYVHYAVTDDGYTIRAATQAEVEEHYAASRPAETQTPERDLSVTSITALSEIGFDDWDAFGVKAANVAVLGRLGFPEGTVPDGFAIPFYFYDEFMNHNDLYDDVREMLADEDFQTDYETKVDELKKLRKKIKKAETPQWIATALTEMHGTYPEGTSLRYRSSTNNEDLPGFNGAGLYDSKTQHPEETEEDGISKSLKQVYASLWNFRAFIERDFHRVDHMAAAMGVLVHPNYSDELVNGVAVSADPAYGTEGTYYLNSQVGEDLVTNPEAHSVPEEVLLYEGDRYDVVSLSNQVTQGQLLMTDDQLRQLRRHLKAIHEEFEELYGVEDDEQFAIEIEFKITSDNVLAIKQARPWIFSGPAPTLNSVHAEDPDDALTARFEQVPRAHRDVPFEVRISFSELRTFTTQEFRDHAVTVTNGVVTSATRVDQREDLWEITVTPDSPYVAVTLVLPENRPCSIPGAICTQNGGRLSNRLEHTVLGRPPAAPTGLNALLVTHDSVTLSWDDPGDSSISGYGIYRRDLSSSFTALQEDTGSTATSYTDTSATPRTRYYYLVKARNLAGTSESSNSISVSTSATPAASPLPAIPTGLTAPTVAHDRVTLSWDDPEDSSIASYQILRRARDGSEYGDGQGPTEFAVIIDDTGTSALTYADESVEAGTRYAYVIKARNPQGLSEASNAAEAQTPEAPASEPTDRPHGLRASVEANTVVLNWNAPDDTSILTMYRILRHRPEEGESELLVYVDYTLSRATSYTDTAVEPGTLYVYSVQAADFLGYVGEASDPASVRVPGSNSPATGALSISGRTQVGKTLAADTSGITDTDGLTNASFSYQWMADEADISGATGNTYTLADADEGKAIKVRVSFTDDDGNDETLTSVATAPVAAALTAEFLDTPSSHNGHTAFTFELRFSEELDLSYVTLRDHTFRVTGGEVTKVRRLERDSTTPNIRWEITVRPTRDGDVTIVLPVTEDCDDQGALCTEDGRMLSTRVEFTVAEAGG